MHIWKHVKNWSFCEMLVLSPGFFFWHALKVTLLNFQPSNYTGKLPYILFCEKTKLFMWQIRGLISRLLCLISPTVLGSKNLYKAITTPSRHQNRSLHTMKELQSIFTAAFLDNFFFHGNAWRFSKNKHDLSFRLDFRCTLCGRNGWKITFYFFSTLISTQNWSIGISSYSLSYYNRFRDRRVKLNPLWISCVY